MANKRIEPLRLSQAIGPEVAQGIELDFIEDGAITCAKGFTAGGIHAGFRKDPRRLDMALVVADELCAAAGVFTTNVFCAAPVIVSREHLNGTGAGTARAIVVNSGIANAATGDTGLAKARETADIVAGFVGCAAEDVLVASTGVIGQQLDTKPFESGVPALLEGISDTVQAGHDAARAIMTTDTVPKECAVSYVSADPALGGATITVGGMVKGSGMIMPNMATMISVVTTDAPVDSELLHEILLSCAKKSFNKVTVDSDTSTNDTCFMMASGKACPSARIERGSRAHRELEAAVMAVCTDLARKIATDGEGATKLVTVNVAGAASDADADLAARAIANSPLVKTAIFGHDCNWGRIAAAVGKSGARFRQTDCSIDIMGMPVCRKGLNVEFSEDEALRRFEDPEIVIDVQLGAGDAATTVWTCDFTHEYVTINGDYRS
ncbi:MAG: bifunctional glutamate N-acetyltransferase/amino-acid acetyltransferase ArgJ [Coriobacteriaceae bacterium]|nr:bifunctional glutamate N-acetyltransferase/amino-acid acetyltransferase ArgJ [Coriobacteriaceae bacterium]MDY3799590.1 bifunctional glutamate N-acetyltransferase/amino-acid acetyltransferase ArgJ [Eggerthellaceae bacterium]